MNTIHAKYVDRKQTAVLVDQWVMQLNGNFPEFEVRIRSLSREQRVPYLREPAPREPVPKADAQEAWFLLYVRLCYIQETLAMSEGNMMFLLRTPDGVKYDDLNGMVYNADLSQGLMIGGA